MPPRLNLLSACWASCALTLALATASPAAELPQLGDQPVVEPRFADSAAFSALTEITLVFTGDNLLGARMPDLIRRQGEAWAYAEVAPALRAADIAFGNLECPITEHATKTPGKSWESIREGRNFIFKAPPSYSGRVLTSAGFDVLSLANNHMMDYCAEGLRDTLVALDQAEIAYVGAGLTAQEAWRACVVSRRGVRVGFIACSMIVPAAARASTEAPGIAAHQKLYGGELSSAISRLAARCDLVVLSLHWGYEGHRQHASYQQQIARAAIDDGADIVIGHHPHCLQGVEFYRGGVIAYSLGNFLFTGKSALIESAILRVTATRSSVKRVELLPVWVRGGRPVPAPLDGQLRERIAGICAHSGTELEPAGEWLLVVAGER